MVCNFCCFYEWYQFLKLDFRCDPSPSFSPRIAQSRSSVHRSANHRIGVGGEAQPAQHVNSHHSNAAHDAAATSWSQSTAASPAPRTACTQSAATGATSAAAHAESAHSSCSTAQHGKLWLLRSNQWCRYHLFLFVDVGRLTEKLWTFSATGA